MHFQTEADFAEAMLSRTSQRGFTPQDLADVVKQLGEFTIDQIKIANAPLRKRISELEVTCAELQAALSKCTKFCGTWQRASDYPRGSLVNHASAGWIAITDVCPNEEPGHARSWQLFLKSPHDDKRAPTGKRTMIGSSVDRRPTD